MCIIPLVATICLDDFYVETKLHVAEVSAPWRDGANRFDRHSPLPLGEINIGIRSEVSREFSFSLGYSHRSSIPVNDQGDDLLFVAFTWRPFR